MGRNWRLALVVMTVVGVFLYAALRSADEPHESAHDTSELAPDEPAFVPALREPEKIRGVDPFAAGAPRADASPSMSAPDQVETSPDTVAPEVSEEHAEQFLPSRRSDAQHAE